MLAVELFFCVTMQAIDKDTVLCLKRRFIPFDSPDTQGAWRKNQPIGLWTFNFIRKPAYGGLANGLAGRDISADKR